MAMNTPENPNAQPGSIWVWAGRDQEGKFKAPLAGLLNCASRLGRRLNATVVLICGASPNADDLSHLAQWDIGEVIPLGQEPPPHPVVQNGASFFAPLLTEPLRATPPKAVLLPHDTFGKVTAPLLCHALKGVLLPGILDLTCTMERWVATRPTMDGHLESLMQLEMQAPLVATLAQSANEFYAGSGDGAPVIRPVPPPAPQSTMPVAMRDPDPATLDLTDAERIVAFGRGAFTPDAQALVYQLAAALGAVVGGTRPAADEGHLPFSRQIGLTGAVVSPRLYVAVGISGAPYHMVGIREPHTFIALNSDPEAPIFQQAHLGLVGDLHQVIPRMLKEIDPKSFATNIDPANRTTLPQANP